MAELAADNFRLMTTPPGDGWYFYRRQGETRRCADTLPQRSDLIELFEASWQLTDRNSKGADVRYHAYVKTQDNGKVLLPNRYCARLEVTLSDQALRLTQWRSWRHSILQSFLRTSSFGASLTTCTQRRTMRLPHGQGGSTGGADVIADPMLGCRAGIAEPAFLEALLWPTTSSTRRSTSACAS